MRRTGFPFRKKKGFALNRLDLQLEKYLDFENGFFVEAGANDGFNQSNTLYFEKYYDWRGILIEPIPDLAALCRQNRPRSVVENCALVPFDYPGDKVEMRYCNLMSLVKGAMKSEAGDSAHIQKGCEIQQLESYDLQVPALTLTAALEKHEVGKIDFLSLDVEGFELNVLKGMNFERYRPRWMLIEARFREEIDSHLKNLYEPVAELSEHDVLYRTLTS